LCAKLVALGFVPSKADTSLFFYNRGKHSVYILVYVDDIIVASSSSEAVSALLNNLKKDFALKDLGDLHYFVGIEVKRNQNGLVLSQGRYACDILLLSSMDKCKTIDTPLCSNEKLSAISGSALSLDDAT